MILNERQYRNILVALVLAGAALRLAGLNWDEGRGLHPDEGNLIRAALELGTDGRLISDFHAYNDLALWLPRLLSAPFCDTADAGCLTHIARLLSALMSVATIPLAAAVARQLAGAAAGIAAAAAFAGAALLVQWAHFGTTESALILLVMALWFVAVRWQSGRIGDGAAALLSGGIIGIGFGLKTTALVLAILPLTALVLAGRPSARRLRAAALGLALALVLALATTPSLIFATDEWLSVMRFEADVVSGRLPVFWTAQFQGAVPGWYELRQLWSATSGAGLVLAVLGLVLMPRNSWRLLAPGLVLAVLYAAIVFGWQARFIRYLAPLVPVILVLAGVAVGRLAQPLISRAALACGVVGIGLMVMAGVDQAAIYMRPDPRIVAESVLTTRAAPGEAVAIEPHDLAQTGGLPRLDLPLTAPEVTADDLADTLSRAGWMIIASSRNWAVLPRQPGAAKAICGFYAGLANGDLGFVPVAHMRRDGPFGRLFAPDFPAEETRRVFDRPEVFLLWNEATLPADEIARRIARPVDPGTCHADALQEAWRRGP